MNYAALLIGAGENRHMWPSEVADWVAVAIGSPMRVDEDPASWIALQLERKRDGDAVGRQLLKAIQEAPVGSMTDEDIEATRRSEKRQLDRWAHDHAEGHGRLEGHGQ